MEHKSKKKNTILIRWQHSRENIEIAFNNAKFKLSDAETQISWENMVNIMAVDSLPFMCKIYAAHFGQCILVISGQILIKGPWNSFVYQTETVADALEIP